MPKGISKYVVISFLMIFQVMVSQNQAPVVIANGNQAFCPGNPIPIVTSFSITDSNDTDIDAFFIQISEGYEAGKDLLSYNINPNSFDISWNQSEGKLTIKGNAGGKIALTDLENVVRNVFFSTTSANPVVEKTFSLTIADANYLPSTNHYYEFISAIDITWSEAKIAAEKKEYYYGLKGYLATLTSQEEADFAGKQAQGSGWIGGTDEEMEGVWKWATGPEAGTTFWNGKQNGSSPNFAFWNNGEPNDNGGNEDYAHITDPSIGIPGAWNDLPNTGGSGDYQAKGYIVEYGGSAGDPTLNISASTKIYIPTILSFTEGEICVSGSTTINATPSEGTILWFDSSVNGKLLHKGTDFTTPNITNTTTYYASVSVDGCENNKRIAIKATVNQRPNITGTTDYLICTAGEVTISANPSAGIIKWYESETSTEVLFKGENFTTNVTANITFYAEANLNGCISAKRIPVNVIINSTIPDFELVKNKYFLCIDAGSVVLETKNPNGNFNYVWTKDNAPFSGNQPNNTITEAGIYRVRAISNAGCESVEKTITVQLSELATITSNDILIIDDADTNSIEVNSSNLGIGDYEFAIDDKFGSYQKVPKFENLQTGVHTLFIKDNNTCGTAEFVFSIVNYPKFFTPNNDGKNDFWNLNGFDSTRYSASDIYIYNRFGKLIYKIETNQIGWDGTLNGKQLEANDYWFYVMLKDKNGLSVEKKGHFSLIRN